MFPGAERSFAKDAFRIVVGALLVFPITPRAELPTIDPAFPAGTGPDYFVRTLARQPDGRLLIAGAFTNVNGTSQPQFARLNADGTVDTAFAPQINSDPRRMVALADGHILVVGTFTNVGGVARAGIARLNSDGSLDPSFIPPTLSPPSGSYGGGFVGTNGSVLVTGTFTNVGGFPRNRLARLLANGSLDLSFQSPFTPTNLISIVALQPDDKAIVAGSFLAVAGATRNGLVRLNADGSLDDSFQPAIAVTNRVSQAILQADGRLVTVVYPASDSGFPSGPQRLIRLNADGSIDPTLDTQFSFPGFPFNGILYSLAIQADGKILATGRFLRADGTPRAGVVRMQPDGGLDYCFELGLASELTAYTVEPFPDGTFVLGGFFSMIQGKPRAYLARVMPVAACEPGIIEFGIAATMTSEDSARVLIPVVRRGGADQEQTVMFSTRDGTAVAGEDYDAVNGTLRFARGERSGFISIPIRRDGSVDDGELFYVALSTPGGGATLGSRTNAVVTIRDAPPGTAGAPDTNFVVQLDAPVQSILPLIDGRVLVAGLFTNVNGQPNPCVALLKADGSLDTSFVRSESLDGDARALALTAGGQLLVGGGFTHVDGAWQPALARFNPDGSLDRSFAPFASWPTNVGGYSVEIEEVAALADGGIVCGGTVPLEGYGTQPALLKISASGELDAAFGSHVPAWIRASRLVPLSNGDFFVGGSGLGSSLVLLHADGTVNLDFNPVADLQSEPYYNHIGVLPDGRIVMTGVPSSSAGLPGQPLLWRFNPDGSADTSFSLWPASPDVQVGYGIESFGAAPDGRVVIAGENSGSSGPSIQCLRLHADGSLDRSFDQGAGLTPSSTTSGLAVNSLVAVPAGGWLVGGDFGGYDGFNQPYLVRLLPESMSRPLEFQFTLTNLTVFETNRTVNLEVFRRGDASQPASVTVRTQDGTAIAGEDFAALNTTIDFAPGEWKKTVTLNIQDDWILESSEQFTVQLADPTGGFSLRQPSGVTIQIISDDAGAEFITDSFHGVEEDGFALAGLRWIGSSTAGMTATVNIVPENGDVGDLLETPITVTRVLGFTNWFRIGITENSVHQSTRQFRLELVPGVNVVPGPRSNATLVIDDLDFTTTPSRGVAGVVEAIANSPGGGVYLAGDFTGVHGVPRLRVVRLLSNGEVDASFDPGPGPDGNVTAIAVQADGDLLIAGDFQKVGGISRAHVARMKPDGSLDPAFDPGGGPISSIGNPFIRSLVATSDGRILVGGSFSQFNGQTRALLVRLLSNGGLDSGFVPPFTPPVPPTKFPPTGNAAIQSLSLQPDGKVITAGYLGSLGSVIRLTASGQRDPGFRTIIATNLDQTAWSLATNSDGKILVGGGGLYGAAGIGAETNWIAIRRYNTNGLFDPTFLVRNAPGINFYASEIRQILVQPDGRILFVAAIFLRNIKPYPNILDRVVVGRLLPDGDWDDGFELLTCAIPIVNQAGPYWFNIPQLNRSPVLPPVPTAFVAQQQDGITVLGGAFDSVNGVSRRRLARVEPDGRVRGVLRLGINGTSGPELFVPPEVESPYVIESAPDLQSWLPWRTNTFPWFEWREVVPPGSRQQFYRAHVLE